MKRLIALAVLFIPFESFAQEKHANPAAIKVVLPKAEVSLSYVEASEGMMIYVESKGVIVKGQRVFIGDGKVAVEFEANINGFFGPDGRILAARANYKNGDVIKITPMNQKEWGKLSGAVYILTPGITFEVPAKK